MITTLNTHPFRPQMGKADYDIQVRRNGELVFVIEFAYPDRRPGSDLRREALINVRRAFYTNGRQARGMALVTKRQTFRSAENAKRWERENRKKIIAEMLQYVD